MASLLKPWIVRYRDAEGRIVPKGTPGAVKVKERAEKWYGQYKDAAGKRCRVPLCTDKQEAKRMLAKLEVDALRGQLGMADPYADHRSKPLHHHLEDFRGYLAAKGNVAEYVQKTFSQILTILDGCRFVRIADLQPSAVVEFLAALRQASQSAPLDPTKELFTAEEVATLLQLKPEAIGRMARRRLLPCQGTGRARRFRRDDVQALVERHRRGLGISTCNHYLTAIKQFSKWLVRDGRAGIDPLAHLSRLNARTDVRRRRRCLPPEAFACLLDAAMQGLPFRHLPGEDRAILYLFAVNTGFRAKEIASLTPASFHLDAAMPTVTVTAAYSKHRREDVQTLRRDMAEVMQAYLASKPADGRLWPGNWWKNAAEMLRIDLEAAGIPYEDAAGCVFDFHGTRHKFISDLAASGVHPKMAQVLARHSTITLTMDHYTHLELHDQTAALEKLPELPKPGKKEDRQQNTGVA
jgi:excisionase family DNA binding protein